jgi:3',5'-cyclic-AMP phosphodiesterase
MDRNLGFENSDAHNDGSQINGSPDGIDRRGMLECMAWVGTGLLWSFSGGIPTSRVLARDAAPVSKGTFSFVQISDSHLGFSRAPNKDVAGTLRETVARINRLRHTPSLLLHTGDITHSGIESEFDACDQILREAHVGERVYVPGEHDVYDEGRLYLERYGKRTRGAGWQSFDDHGVHFVGLVNVLNVDAGQLGRLGAEQLTWLKTDLASLADSTPIVVFAHVPLWSVYPQWGWGTQDAAQALQLLRRFGSVTVLNGHIHQTLQKVEGHITFHTACSTAFPQPKPGSAPSPGPMKGVPAEKLKRMLGLTSVRYVEGEKSLAIVDVPLEGV